MTKLSRYQLTNGAVLAVLYALTLVFAAGCAGTTPAAKYAEKRQALTSLNDTFSDAVDAGQLSDRQTVDIGTVLKMGTAYLDAAKAELPEGGTEFEANLRKAQRVLDLIKAQLAARAKEQPTP